MPPGPSSTASTSTTTSEPSNNHLESSNLNQQQHPQSTSTSSSSNAINPTLTSFSSSHQPQSSQQTPKSCARCGQLVTEVDSDSNHSNPISDNNTAIQDQESNILCHSCFNSVTSLSSLSGRNRERDSSAEIGMGMGRSSIMTDNQIDITRDGNGNLVRVQLQPDNVRNQNTNAVEDSNAGLLRRLREDANGVRGYPNGGDDEEMRDLSTNQTQEGIHSSNLESSMDSRGINDEEMTQILEPSSVDPSLPINQYPNHHQQLRGYFSSGTFISIPNSNPETLPTSTSNSRSPFAYSANEASTSTSSLTSPVRNRRESFSRSQTSPNSSFGASVSNHGRIGVGIPSGSSDLGSSGMENGDGNVIESTERIDDEIRYGDHAVYSFSDRNESREYSSTGRSRPRVSFPSSSSSNLRQSYTDSIRDQNEEMNDSEMRLSETGDIESASLSNTSTTRSNPKSSSSSSSFGPQLMTRSRISQSLNSNSNFSSGSREDSNERIQGAYQKKYNLSILPQSPTSTASSSSKYPTSYYFNPSLPDPLQDSPLLSTRRLLPSSMSCLFPGSIFKGTQKSGRSSYEVQVSILNLDLKNSSLCGYLNIRGLTKDWPELTTFFEAEIIGDRFGFLTKKDWGATEKGDLKHWVRWSKKKKR